MSARIIAIGTLCLSLLACHNKAQPEAKSPAPPPPETAMAPPPAPPPPPAAPARLAPPQRWEEIGHRGDERVVMGSITWKGGESVDVQLMGSMKELLEMKIADAIKAKPDDPVAAIQGVLDEVSAMLGGSKVIEWVKAT